MPIAAREGISAAGSFRGTGCVGEAGVAAETDEPQLTVADPAEFDYDTGRSVADLVMTREVQYPLIAAAAAAAVGAWGIAALAIGFVAPLVIADRTFNALEGQKRGFQQTRDDELYRTLFGLSVVGLGLIGWFLRNLSEAPVIGSALVFGGLVQFVVFNKAEKEKQR